MATYGHDTLEAIEQVIRHVRRHRFANVSLSLNTPRRRIIHGPSTPVVLGKVGPSQINSGDTDGIVQVYASPNGVLAPTATGDQLTDVAFDWMTNGDDLPVDTEVKVETINGRRQITMWECP